MPEIDSKVLISQLKNGEIHNLYYLYGKNVNGVENATKAIIKKTVGDYSSFALTKIDGKAVNISELTDLVEMLPMMSEYNCILINDYNCDEQKEDLNKSLIEVLKKVPSQTVVILNVTGFDAKNGKKKLTPKNKKLADTVSKNGIVCEYPIPTNNELSNYIVTRVKKNGCSISSECANEIVSRCLGDTLTVKNEVDKLCSYALDKEITFEMVDMLVNHQTDIDVYKLADAVCKFDRNRAFTVLDELMAKKTERIQIIFAISGAFIDLYRAGVAKKCGKQVGEVVHDFGYAWEFLVKNAFRDSSRISLGRIRKCLAILRDTAVKLNSTAIDERVVIENAISQMLILTD